VTAVIHHSNHHVPVVALGFCFGRIDYAFYVFKR
jgi:hypothetical protein